jgi:hypothetical protein
VFDGAVGAQSLLDWKIDMATSLGSSRPLGGKIGEASKDTPALTEADGITPSMEWTSTFGPGIPGCSLLRPAARGPRLLSGDWASGRSVTTFLSGRCSTVWLKTASMSASCAPTYPSSPDLFRWSRSTVGSAVTGDLLKSVGSCFAFYRQYFAERTDLRGAVD